MRTKPTVEDRKVPRSISIRQSVDELARERGIDLNKIVEETVLMACAIDDKTQLGITKSLAIESLSRQLSSFKSQIAILEVNIDKIVGGKQ